MKKLEITQFRIETSVQAREKIKYAYKKIALALPKKVGLIYCLIISPVSNTF